MAVVELTPQLLPGAGGTTPQMTPTFAAAAADGNSFKNTGREFVIVRNAHGSASRTVTVTPITGYRPADGRWPTMQAPQVSVAVPAGQERMFGPLPSAYTDIDGKVTVSFSTSADVSLFVGRLDPL